MPVVAKHLVLFLPVKFVVTNGFIVITDDVGLIFECKDHINEASKIFVTCQPSFWYGFLSYSQISI